MDTANFLANSSHIAEFGCKPYPQPLPKDAVTLGFEKYAYDKIVSELQSDNHVIKAKAVVAARDLLVAPTKHIQCVAAGITPALIDILKDPNPHLQAEAAATLQLLVVRDVGCSDFLQHQGLQQLLQLLKQPDPAVKDAAYQTLCTAAKFESCRAAVFRQEGGLGLLVRHAQQEEPDRAAQALQLLLHCTQMQHNQDVLSNLIAVVQAIPKLAAMISNTAATMLVRLRATKLLAVLTSTQEDARKQAVDCGCVKELLQLAACGSADMACAAAEALMMITITREGKVAVHEAKGTAVLFNALLGLVSKNRLAAASTPNTAASTEETCIVNLLETFSGIAEYPPCREELQRLKAGELLQTLQQQHGGTPSDLVQRAAVQALRLIGFHNWPQ